MGNNKVFFDGSDGEGLCFDIVIDEGMLDRLNEATERIEKLYENLGVYESSRIDGEMCDIIDMLLCDGAAEKILGSDASAQDIAETLSTVINGYKQILSAFEGF